MPEVKVEKQTSVVRRETPELNPFNDFFAAGFPTGRFFGLSPFRMMREFNREMDRAFGRGSGEEIWAPTVDIQRCSGDLVVTAELPGLKKEEVKVEVTDDALVIQGERNREHKEDHEGYHRYERNYGKFYRSIPLPEGTIAEQAKAEMTNGLLKITVPAPAKKQSVRQIAINEGTPAPAASAPSQPVAA
jgi:HSP20 family protein